MTLANPNNGSDVERGYVGPAIVRLRFISDSKWNGRRVTVVGWHPTSFKCRVRVGRRMALVSPGCLIVPTSFTGDSR